MPGQTQRTGAWGEQAAAAYLEKMGARIRERNWRWGHLEIDLIADWNNILVFVEVKVRKDNAFGYPEAFVTKTKARNIRRASTEYQYRHGISGFIRFDIMAITGNEQHFELRHFPDAF